MAKNGVVTYSFEILFISLITLIVLPSSLGLEEDFWVKVFLTIILLSSLYMMRLNRRNMILGSSIGVCVLFFSWGEGFFPTEYRYLYLSFIYMLFFSFICYYLMNFLIKTKKANTNVIFAAMCLYIFISNIWMFIYTFIFSSNPEAFTFSDNLIMAPDATFYELVSMFSYYSFVTLTTLGYGDISPVSQAARAWVSVESMLGQFYIAIVLAKLVAVSVDD